MNPRLEPISYIENERILDRYELSWKNKGRVSDNWKVKLYEQAKTGLQLAIYDRKDTTIVRIEHSVSDISGIAQKEPCPKGDALCSDYSNFKDGKGVCLVVGNLAAFKCLLEQYFGQAIRLETLEDVIVTFEREFTAARSRTSAERRARLATAPKKPKQITVQTTVFHRNADVRAEVLERAVGKCESCRSHAPFLRTITGEPYLEVHHRIRLADGGDDTVANAIALCPNCHREKHFG